jgi:amino acid adenylation domain-containing protein
MSRALESDSFSHWQQKLAGDPPALTLPIGSATQPGGAASTPFAPDEALSARFAELVSGRGASLDDGRLAAFVVLLYRSTRQTDLVLGASAGEPVGATVLPLRVQLEGTHTFAGVLDAVRAEREEARAHALAPDELLTAVGRSGVRELFQVALIEGDAEVEGLDLVLRPGEGLGGTLVHDGARLGEADARGLLARFERLLEGIVAGPDEPIGELPFLTDAERRTILTDWNAKEVDFPRDRCLHELFEERADAEPGAVAAVFDGQELTYRELDERANQLAHHLTSLGIGPESLVGISVERSLEMVIGLLGIAKAGGAYLPMDPAYPKERLAFMLEDSGVTVLLTQKHLADSLPPGDARRVFLDGDAAALAQQPTTRPAIDVGPENLSYVIYTSGSTGAPKGVVLDHLGRVNNFCDFNRRFDVGPGDALIALASLSFDMCAYDVFGTLAAGATIVLPRPSEMQDPVAWSRILRERNVTVWHTAPAMLGMLVEHLEAHPDEAPASLRLVLLGGDWIPVALPDRLRALTNRVRVISMGGATECSMDSTIYEVLEVDPTWKSIPYGEPMWNQRAYVLDEDLQPVPVGAAGELFLGGVGVARGYHQRPELTAERFLDDPFWDEEGARMYRTGDLARWMPDGNLELLGRLDNQVKIRGYRIELGEIEALLNKHAAVKEGVIVTRDDAAGEKRLMAYVVQDPGWTGPEDSNAGAERVEEWQAVYDHAYGENAEQGAEDPTFNIVSWDSSYTNEPLPAEEMRVWVEETVARIASRAPERVLEIGCGMGLLLFRLAPSCTRYIGTDFSRVALDYVRGHAQRLGLEQVELESRWADDFTGIEPDSLDAIVLNSIVLDFPGMDYLMDVLRGSVRAVRPGGTIFVGDVRSRPLLEAYQGSVQLHQADAETRTADLRSRVQRLIRQEEELVIDPRFFEWLVGALPGIAGVRIQLKRGGFTNELNAFRYDVTILVGEAAGSTGPEPVELDGSGARDLATLRELVTASEDDVLLVRGVLNARTLPAARTAVALASPTDAPETASALRTRLDELACDEGGGVNPEAVWELAGELGFFADLTWSHEGAAEGRFDVLLVRGGSEADARFTGRTPGVDGEGAASDFANNPTMGKLSRQLGPELKAHLAAALPDYMVPAVYVPLDELPLSPNGKVDRKRLPEPDTSRPDMASPYVPPKDPVEEVVAGIWTDVLGLDRVGVEDAFLDLGGHSILAVQIQSRLNEIFPFGVSLPDIFRNRTVSHLSEHIRAQGRSSGIDAEEVCQTLLMIERLSDEEVAARIGG